MNDSMPLMFIFETSQCLLQWSDRKILFPCYPRVEGVVHRFFTIVKVVQDFDKKVDFFIS
ncbi:hypothetical protein Hanom_Chr03g00200301 [Helianthus anomalus]